MKVVVIGAGAAGIIAAIRAAELKNDVILLEKNSSIGNKIKITGKGRCNITFDGSQDDFNKNIVKNQKFMYSSFSNFNNNDVISFFENIGVKTKVERGGRIFPVSDDANEVVDALKKELMKKAVKVKLNANVIDIEKKENGIIVILENKEKIVCDKCIIATGGKSYPKTGSTGDGYNFAKKIGHKIEPILPGLISLKTYGELCGKLQGLSLKNVKIKVIENSSVKEKEIFSDFGEMLFTHFGLSGPTILSASSRINRLENIYEKMKNKEILIEIDLKPALDFDILDKRISRDFEKYATKDFKNSLVDLLPQKLIPVMVDLSSIEPDKKVSQITKQERVNLVKLIKSLRIYIKDFMPIELAVITSGGVDVNQINPKTMESKLVPGIYFAGEVLDLDAYTGGFNLQIAFSTGYAAGNN